MKLVLPNAASGYPILDHGIMNCEKSDAFYIINDNISILKKIQLFLLSPLGLLLINSLKTRQDFLNDRVFQILPDVTQLDFDITDEKLLYKYFGFDKKDIEAIKEQIKSGEGNLTPKETKEILDFDIHTYLTAPQIKTIRESIVKNCNKASSNTLKKKSTPKVKTKRKKCPRGTRRNKKTGECEKVTLLKSISQKGKGKYRTFKKQKHKKNKSRKR